MHHVLVLTILILYGLYNHSTKKDNLNQNISSLVISINAMVMRKKITKVTSTCVIQYDGPKEQIYAAQQKLAKPIGNSDINVATAMANLTLGDRDIQISESIVILSKYIY